MKTRRQVNENVSAITSQATYDWPRIIGRIRELQPNLLIFSMADPDYRWVGNEAGIAPFPCWNTVSSVPLSVNTSKQESVGQPKWLPAECDAAPDAGAEAAPDAAAGSEAPADDADKA